MSDRSHASVRDEFQVLWSALPVPPPVTADQVRRRAMDLAAWKRRRAIGIAAIIAVGVGQTVAAVLFARPLAPWEWAGIAYLVAFAVALLWITLAEGRQPSSTLEGTECVHAYRSLLEHERDANQGRALALRVLLVFFLLGHTAFIAVKNVPATLWPIAILALALAASGAILQRGRVRARLFQMHIDAVDSQRD
jgi:MFS family permease